MKKKLKLFVSLATICFSIFVLAFGVFASRTEKSVSSIGKVDYQINDTFVEIETRVYSSSKKFGYQTDLQIISEEFEEKTFDELNAIQKLDNNSTFNKVQIKNQEEPSLWTDLNTDYYDRYSSVETNEQPSSLDLNIKFSLTQQVFTYFVVTRVTNMSILPLYVYIPIEGADAFSPAVNSLSYKLFSFKELETKGSETYIVFSMTLDKINEAVNSEFKFPICVTNDVNTVPMNVEIFVDGQNEAAFAATANSTLRDILAQADLADLTEYNTSGWFTDAQMTEPIGIDDVVSNSTQLYTKTATLDDLEFYTEDVQSSYVKSVNSVQPLLDTVENYDGYAEFYVIDNPTNKNIVVPKLVQDNNKTYLVTYGEINDKVENLTLPEGITGIEEYQFENSTNLKSINLPSGVKFIEDNAFSGCNSLQNVYVGNNIEYIGNSFMNSNIFANLLYFQDGVLYLTSSDKTTKYLIAANPDELPQNYNIDTKTKIIATAAFIECENLKYIEIPDFVEYIGEGAFVGCTSLEVVKFGESSPISVIDRGTFAMCFQLHTVELPENLSTIQMSAFYSCIQLKSITIPENVEEIYAGAFADCAALEEIYIPNSVSVLEGGTFSGCVSLKKVEYGSESNITEVLEGTFEDCQSLQNVILPPNLKTIEVDSFYNCLKLNNLFIPKTVTTIEQGAFNSAKLKTVTFEDDSEITSLVGIFTNNQTLTTFNFGNNSKITSIEGIFDGCSSLANINFGDNSKIKEIPDYACQNSTLSNITFGDNSELEYIGEGAFAYSNLKSIIFGDNSKLTEIGPGAFFQSTLKTIEFGANSQLEYIGEGAFGQCYSLTTILIPAKVRGIASNTFRECNSLKTIKFEENSLLEYINDYAFENCQSLENVTMPESLMNIGQYAFQNCQSLESIIIPENVTSIGNYAFSNCSNVKTLNYNAIDATFGGSNIFSSLGNSDSCVVLNIGEKVESISDNAFYGISYTKEINFLGTKPISAVDIFYSNNSYINKITLKDVNAWISLSFSSGSHNPLSYTNNLYLNDSLLEEVIVSEDVENIGSMVFYNYTPLKRLTIGKNVKTIGNYAFYNCSKIETLNIESKNLQNFSESNYIFYNLGINTTSGTTVNFGEEVENVPSYLFLPYSTNGNCAYVTTVNFLGDKVKNIGDYAFKYCDITEIKIPDTVTTIGASAFSSCTYLENITIPENVETIGSNAFSHCTNLEEINYNAINVTSANSCFGNSQTSSGSGIKLKIGENVESIPANIFSSGKIYFVFFLGDKVNFVGQNAFKNSNLLAVDVQSLEAWFKIDFENEFANPIYYTKCIRIDGVIQEEITLPSNITEIKNYSMYHNHSLKSIKITNELESVGNYAFYWCDALTIDKLNADNVGNYAFYNCISLEIEDLKVENIGNYAFYSCTSLEIDDLKVKNVGDHAFENCRGIQNVEFLDNTTTIGTNAFYNCSNIKKLTVPESVTSIGNYAFSYCNSLQEINWNATSLNKPLTTDSRLFREAGKTSGSVVVNFGENVESIPDYLFYTYYSDTYPLITQVNFNCSNLASIGAYSFWYLKNLKQISIPETVTSIGTQAFYNCTTLKSINISETITSIGERAFYGCTNVQELNWNAINPTSLGTNIFYDLGNSVGSELDVKLTFGANVENLPSVFSGTKIKTVEFLGNKVSEIKPSAFSSCSSLKNITLPDSITTIGSSAFSGCTSLESIIIPTSVTEIAASTFSSCSSLKNIEIPEGVTTIGNSAFHSCSSLESIEIPEGVTTIGQSAFYSCSSLESITIPEGITVIAASTFYNCSSLKNIEIPENVTTIESSAFSSCSSLESITIPEGVTTIGNSAFAYNASLKEINWNVKQLTTSLSNSYSDGIFYSSCSDDSVINFGTNVEDIPAYLFYGSSSSYPKISQLNFLGDKVISIGQNAFYYCQNLKNIVIPNSVKTIGQYAFYNCIGLTSVSIPENLETINNRAFSNCTALTKIIWNAVELKTALSTSSSDNIFYNAGSVSNSIEVEFGANVEIIPAYLFYGSSSNYARISSINFLGEKVTTIGKYSFCYCKNLTSLELPNGLSTIDEYAFRYCSAITELTVPESLITINNRAFADFNALQKINWNAVKPNDITTSSYLFNNAGLNSGSIIVEFGENVEYIPANLFYNSSTTTYARITEVKFLGNKVSSIGNNAFGYCIDLTKLTVPESVTSIGNNAFSYCNSLQEINWNAISLNKPLTTDSKLFREAGKTSGSVVVNFGENVQSIPDYLFHVDSSYYPRITEVKFLGNNLKTIGKYSFYYCSLLSKIDLPSSLTEIGTYAFSYCSALLEITIPEKLLTISDYTFQNCTQLATVIIPNGVQTINGNAFENDSSLTTVILGNSVNRIKYRAFYNCSAISKVYYVGSETDRSKITFESYNTTLTNATWVYDCVYEDNVYYYKDGENYIAFELQDKYLTSVNIKAGTTQITANLFKDCTKLLTVVMPASVTNIGDYAFDGCTSLTTIAYMGSETDKANIVYTEANNSSLTTATWYYNVISENDVYYSVNAEDQYTALALSNSEAKVITLNEKTIKINENAFFNRDSLIKVVIGTNVSNIGENAFLGCVNLVEVVNKSATLNIIAGQESNGYVAYYATNVVTSEDDSSIFLENNIYYQIEGENYLALGLANREVESVTFKEKTIKIADGMFSNVSKLTSVTIPDTVTYIGDFTFENCISLQTVNIGAGVEVIGKKAFYGCSALTAITIPTNVKEIQDNAFMNCSKLATVTLEEGVQIIGTGAFIGCTGLTTVNMSNSITLIGDYAFNECNRLSTITLSAGLEEIGSYAFNKCSALTTINIPNSVKTIKDYAFSECTGISTLTLGTGLKSIGNYSFYKCSRLTSLEIPDNVETIGSYSFANCSKIASLTIGSGLKTIESYSFYYCNELVELVIPDTVETINKSAFEGSQKLRAVKLGSNVKTIGDSAFNCSRLGYVINNSSLELTLDNSNYGRITNYADYLYNGDYEIQKVLVGNVHYYVCGEDYIATAIEDKTISTVELDSRTKVILSYTYYDCTTPTTITELTIPEGITRVGDYNFQKYTALTQVTILDTVIKIGNFNFYNCSGLATVNYCNSEEEFNKITIEGNTSTSGNRYLFNATKVYMYGWEITSTVSATCSEDAYTIYKRGDETKQVAQSGTKLGHSIVSSSTGGTCSRCSTQIYSCTMSSNVSYNSSSNKFQTTSSSTGTRTVTITAQQKCTISVSWGVSTTSYCTVTLYKGTSTYSSSKSGTATFTLEKGQYIRYSYYKSRSNSSYYGYITITSVTL